MKKEEKLDFSKAPITLEVGIRIETLIKQNKTNFSVSIDHVCKTVNNSKGITVPKIRITDNSGLKPTEYRLSIYGKTIRDSILPAFIQEKDILSVLISNLDLLLNDNSFYFKENFIVSKKRIEELKHEQSREAYQQLYRYYSNIELDEKQAFHWLKKMSYYGVPDDLRKLANCYSNRIGCEKDIRQCEKLHALACLDSNSKIIF